ncbi:type II toxin-antitoxin system Phd/YefM family antitoxin [bacterium]|nr:MAG: type II toxin-antitoxin system Phd/YefM family antitoxin [bacterium]
MLKNATIDVREIHPLTDFLRNSKAHIAHLKETGGPEVLTVNGRAEVVVQDAVTYQELLDRLERAELVVSLRTALTQIKEGQGVSLEALETELNGRYGA